VDWQHIVKSDRGEESEMKFTARIAAASLALATATAGAQGTPTKPYPPGFLKELAQQMISQGQSMRAGNLNGGVLNIGLNVVHATNCVALQIGGHVVGCIFSQEGLFVCSLNPSRPASATAGAACTNGNFVGINVIDTQGNANEIISFPTK
jgi:hypothetical protein